MMAMIRQPRRRRTCIFQIAIQAAWSRQHCLTPPRIKGASVHWRKACVRNPNPKSEPTAARNALQHQSVQRGYGAAHPPGIPSHFPSSPHLPDTNDRISRHRGDTARPRGLLPLTLPVQARPKGASASAQTASLAERGRPASKPKTRRRAMESNKTRPYEAAEGIATSPSGMSRRSFLAGAAAFGAGAAAFGLAGCQPNKDAEAQGTATEATPDERTLSKEAEQLDYDVVVIGAGTSGTCARLWLQPRRAPRPSSWRKPTSLAASRTTPRSSWAPALRSNRTPDTTSLPTSCMPHTANTTRAPAIFPWCAPSSTTLPIPSTGSWATGSGSSPAPKACRSSRTCPATKRCAAT